MKLGENGLYEIYYNNLFQTVVVRSPGVFNEISCNRAQCKNRNSKTLRLQTRRFNTKSLPAAEQTIVVLLAEGGRNAISAS